MASSSPQEVGAGSEGSTHKLLVSVCTGHVEVRGEPLLLILKGCLA